MAFAVARRSGGWELRESRSTRAGPRAQTLASFRVLTPEVVERARERAGGSLSAVDIRRAATRAGAPIAPIAPNAAAAALLAELAVGHQPSVAVQRLLVDALPSAEAAPSDSERAAARWIAASLEERGAALRDLLLLADRLPSSSRSAAIRFPRLESATR